MCKVHIEACKVHTEACKVHTEARAVPGAAPGPWREQALREAYSDTHFSGCEREAGLGLFLLEGSATARSPVHDLHTRSWSLRGFAGGEAPGGGLGVHPSCPCPAGGLRVWENGAPLRAHGLGIPPPVAAEGVLQGSWGHSTTGTRMACARGWCYVLMDGQRQWVCSSQPAFPDLPSLLSQSLHPSLHWPPKWGSPRT